MATHWHAGRWRVAMSLAARRVVAFVARRVAAAAERPALIDAARNADREALRALIQKKVDVNAADADGTTALHWASYRDDLDSVDLLIRAGANVNAANDLGATPLWNASLNAGAPHRRSGCCRQARIRTWRCCSARRR